MPRRGFQESAPQGGMAQFTAGAPPAAPPTVATDYSGIQQALSGFTAISMQRDARQAEADAAVAQEIAGVSGVAQPEGFMLPSAARAFEQRAQAVYSQQLQTEATATAAELLRNHLFDPEGFEQAWNAYTEGKLKSLQDDPVFAANVGLALNDMGVRQRTQIETNVFERTQEGISVEMTAAFQSQINATQDQILTYPNEAFVVENKAMLEEQIAEMDASGIFAPRQIEAFRAQLNDTLYGAYIEGKIRDATETGDIATLQTLHHDLQRGAYFDNNETALRFANRITSSLGGNVSRAEIRGRLDAASVALQQLQSGIPLSEDVLGRLNADADFIERFGTDDDKIRFSRDFSGIVLTEQFLPVLRNGAISDLENAIAYLSEFDVQLMSSEVVASLRESLQARIAQMEEAQVDADLATLGSADWREMTIVEFMNASNERRAELMRLGEFNRDLVAERQGVSREKVIPLTAAQISEFASLMQTANANQNSREYQQLHEDYMAMFEGDVYTAGKAMEGADASIAGGMLLGHALASEALGSAVEMRNLAAMGSQMRNTPANHEAYRNNLIRGAAYSEVVDAISAGSGKLNNAVTEALASAMLAMQVTGTQPAEAKTAIEVYLDQIDVRRLNNDALVVPKFFSDSPAEAEALINLAETFLEENRLSLGPDAYANFRPVPSGTGSVRLYNAVRGMFLKEPDNITIREFSLPRERREEILEQEFATAQEIERQYQIEMENRLQLVQRDMMFFEKYGEAAGLAEDEITNLYKAISFSPATSMTNLPNGILPMMQGAPMQTDPDRPVGWGISQEAREAIDFARGAISDLAMDARFQPTQTDVLRGATVLEYANLLDQFGRDQEKALAALVSSPEDVDTAVEMFGDNWLNEMDLSVRVFVHRGFGIDDPEQFTVAEP